MKSLFLAVILSGCLSFNPPKPDPLPTPGPAKVLTVKFAPDGPKEGGLYVCSPRDSTVYCVEYAEFRRRLSEVDDER